MTVLKDSELVWQFQSFFGVKKVGQIENVKDGPWVVQDAGSWRLRRERTEQRKRTEKPPDRFKSSDEGKDKFIHDLVA